MSPTRLALIAATLLSVAANGYAQEPARKPDAAEAAADGNEERPPEKPDAAPAPPAVANEPRDESGTEAAKDTGSNSRNNAADTDHPGTNKESKTEPKRELPREAAQEYAACRLALSLLGTVYEERPKITEADNAECGINKPLHVSEILPGVTLQGGAIMRCDTARALGFWTQQFLRPASANLPGAPRLTGMQLGTTYDCRARNGTGKKQPKLSEHALGNAIDIAAFEFDDGQTVKVEPRQDTGDLLEAFQRAARGSACLYFTTVLGPGSNAAHSDHLHLDVKARKNGWRLCQ